MAEIIMDFEPQLLPDDGDLYIDEVGKSYPSLTYKLDLDGGRIRGKVDGMEAIKQAIYKLLDTPAGVYPIYSPNYGLFLLDLIGKNHAIFKSEIKRRIRQAALVDDRIVSVDDFNFEQEGDILKMTLKVKSITGEIAEIEGSVALS
jgi:phage baseplate assembly protein W